MPLLTSLALTPKKPVANRTVAQLLRGTAAAQGLVRLRRARGCQPEPWVTLILADARNPFPRRLCSIFRGFGTWTPANFSPAPKKITKQSWNVDDNKALLFLESHQSWNVYENTASYAKKLEYY